MVVSDNGTEPTGNAILKRQENRTVERHSIAPGKPMRDMGSLHRSMAGCGMNR